jgi:hypothetical protein
MTEYQDVYLSCSCCGAGILNNAEQNVHFGLVPYPDDQGFGMCKDCGGDKDSDDIKKRMGWGMVTFVEARFDTIRKNLSEKNQKNWDRCSWEKKACIVLDFVEKGVMI